MSDIEIIIDEQMQNIIETTIGEQTQNIVETTIGDQAQDIVKTTIMTYENTTTEGTNIREDMEEIIAIHNQSSNAHKNLIKPINQKIETIEQKCETYVKITSVPTKVSQLENDAGYINDISNKANTDLDNISQSAIDTIKSYWRTLGRTLTPFCVNSASVDSNGNGNLLNYTGINLNFNGAIIATTANGTTFGHDLLQSVDMTNKANGTYKFAISQDSNIPFEISNVFVSANEPMGELNTQSLIPTATGYITSLGTITYSGSYYSEYYPYLSFGNNTGSWSMYGAGAYMGQFQFATLQAKGYYNLGFQYSSQASAGTQLSNIKFLAVYFDDTTKEVWTQTEASSDTIKSVSVTFKAEKEIKAIKFTNNLTGANTGSVTKINLYKYEKSNAIWLNTSVEKLKAYLIGSGNLIETNLVPIGECIVSGGIITSVKTYPYNQNGYDINTNTLLPVRPLDYSKGITVPVATEYKAVASGIIFGQSAGNSATNVYVNSYQLPIAAGGTVANVIVNYNFPVAKGDSINVSGAQKLAFYPFK